MKQAPPTMFYVAKAKTAESQRTAAAFVQEPESEESGADTTEPDGDDTGEEGPEVEGSQSTVDQKTTYSCLRGPGSGVYAGRPKRKRLAREKLENDKLRDQTASGEGRPRKHGVPVGVRQGGRDSSGPGEGNDPGRAGGGKKEKGGPVVGGGQSKEQHGERSAERKRVKAVDGAAGHPKGLSTDSTRKPLRSKGKVKERTGRSRVEGGVGKDPEGNGSGTAWSKQKRTTGPRSKRRARSNSGIKGIATEGPKKPGRSGKGKRRTTARDIGDGFRVGCACRFIVVSYKALPDLVEVRLLEQRHSNHCTASCGGAGCVHFPDGVDGRRSLGKLAHLAPRLSDGCRAFVRQVLSQYPGIKNQEVFKKVREWCGAGTSELESETARAQHVHTRDMGLTGKDVQNIRREVEKAAYQRAEDPARSVYLFAQQEPGKVFLYRQQFVVAETGAGEDRAEGARGEDAEWIGAAKGEKVDQLQSFHLGLCTPWQREMLERHGRTVCLDSTFGVNDLAFPLFTVLVVDGHWHGVPVAWDLASGQTTEDIVLMLSSLKASCPGWQPKVFIVDDCRAEINAIREVFPDAEIILCDFHVKKTFIKQIIAKVTGGTGLHVVVAQPLQKLFLETPSSV